MVEMHNTWTCTTYIAHILSHQHWLLLSETGAIYGGPLLCVHQYIFLPTTLRALESRTEENTTNYLANHTIQLRNCLRFGNRSGGGEVWPRRAYKFICVYIGYVHTEKYGNVLHKRSLTASTFQHVCTGFGAILTNNKGGLGSLCSTNGGICPIPVQNLLDSGGCQRAFMR